MQEANNDRSVFSHYLELLGVKPKRPGYAALEELVAAHMKRIPFENISKLYYLKRDGLKNIPSFEQYLSGIEQYGFGGTCYSNNHYLNELLRHLGYQAMLCGADMSIPDCHLVNMVTVDGREFLVDAGYAAPFLKPMPRYLDHAHEVRLGRDRYVLHPKDDNGCSRMDLFRNGELTHGYTAKPIDRRIDFFTSSIQESYRDDSTFMNSLLLVKLHDDSSTVIYNLSVIRSHGNTHTVQPLKNEDELIETIERVFGIPADIVSEAVSMLHGFGNAWN